MSRRETMPYLPMTLEHCSRILEGIKVSTMRAERWQEPGQPPFTDGWHRLGESGLIARISLWPLFREDGRVRWTDLNTAQKIELACKEGYGRSKERRLEAAAALPDFDGFKDAVDSFNSLRGFWTGRCLPYLYEITGTREKA